MALCAMMCACGQQKGTSGETHANILGEWAITLADTLATDRAEQTPYIHFTDSGTVHGCAAVNNFFGHYATNGDTIAFTLVGTTMMMGADEDMLIEAAVLQALNTGKSIEVQDSTLTLKNAEGKALLTLKRK